MPHLAAALLALCLAVPVAGATSPLAYSDTANPSIAIDQARELVIASELEDAFRQYPDLAAGEVRMLIVVDRPGPDADLALARDGTLWMVSRGRATPATSRDLADAHIGRLRLLLHLQARKIRPIAVRIPASWLVGAP